MLPEMGHAMLNGVSICSSLLQSGSARLFKRAVHLEQFNSPKQSVAGGRCTPFRLRIWQRSKLEVSTLLSLIGSVIEHELPTLVDTNVRVQFMGDLASLPASLQAIVGRSA